MPLAAGLRRLKRHPLDEKINPKEVSMSASIMTELSGSRDAAKPIAYMALGVALVAVVLLGVYVYRSMKPMPVIKELQEAQAATASEVKDLEGRLQSLSTTVAAVEETVRRDKQAAALLDLKRSLIVLQEVRKQAPEDMKAKIVAIEEQLNSLADEVARPSPKKHLEIRSVQ